MGGIIYKFLDCGREAGVPRGSPHGPEENMQAPHGEAPAGIRTWDLHDVGLLCYLFIHLFIYPEINVFFQREMQLSTGTMDNRATRNSNTTQKTSQDKKRKMLIFCLLLLIYSQHIEATPEICEKEWLCDAPVCFEIKGSSEPACTSTSHRDLCRFNGSCIEYKCDADLSCKCNGRLIELADLTKCPGKHVESFSGTSWKTGVAVAVAVAAAVAVGVPVTIVIICRIRKNRGSLCSGCGSKDTERQGDPELGETGPQTPPLAEGQVEVELDDMNDASIKNSPRPVETQGQDASDGAAGRGAGVVHSQVAPKNKTKKGKGKDGEGHGEGPPRVLHPEEEPLVTGEMEGNPE